MTRPTLADLGFRAHKEDLRGHRQGSVVVLHPLPIRYSRAGHSLSRWWVRCDCGAEWSASLSSLKGYSAPRLESCEQCGHHRAGVKTSIRLPSGMTIAEVSRRSGLALGTVYHRWIRGWPEALLGSPAQKPGTHQRRAQ